MLVAPVAVPVARLTLPPEKSWPRMHAVRKRRVVDVDVGGAAEERRLAAGREDSPVAVKVKPPPAGTSGATPVKSTMIGPFTPTGA